MNEIINTKIINSKISIINGEQILYYEIKEIWKKIFKIKEQ